MYRMNEIGRPPKVFILRMRHVPAVDATGIHALVQLAHGCHKHGTTLLLTEIRKQPLRAIVRARKLEALGGRQSLAKTFEMAVDRARELAAGSGRNPESGTMISMPPASPSR